MDFWELTSLSKAAKLSVLQIKRWARFVRSDSNMYNLISRFNIAAQRDKQMKFVPNYNISFAYVATKCA